MKQRTRPKLRLLALNLALALLVSLALPVTAGAAGTGINLGYGIGWHFLGRLELMPYALVGAQLAGLTKGDLQYYNEEQERWTDFPGGMAGITPFFAGHAGLRLNVNLWYPVQLTVGADYNCNIPLNKKNEAAYDNHDLNRLNFYAGLRFNL